MTFVPPPLAPDVHSSQPRGRTAAALRKPWVGAGLLAAVLAVVHRRRHR